jgi:hypothetical protein
VARFLYVLGSRYNAQAHLLAKKRQILTSSCLGMKTVRIFFARIRDRICLERFGSARIRVRIFNIRYRMRIRISNCIFMMSIFNHILSSMIDTIRIRIRIRTEI